MSSLLKKDTKGSIVVEAAIVFPIIVVCIFYIILYFNAFFTDIKVERSIYYASKELMTDYSKYNFFEGIVENIAKKEALKKEFTKKLDEELKFREIDEKIKNLSIDFSKLFDSGENEGYLKCDFSISKIRFSKRIFLKAIGNGIKRSAEWDDVWRLEPMLRGRIIIEQFGGNMSAFFELISRFRDGEACVIKSLDPDKPSYVNSNSIFERIAPYIDKLSYYSLPINGCDITNKKLMLVIPKDARSLILSSEIDKLRAECINSDIIFELVSYGFLYK